MSVNLQALIGVFMVFVPFVRAEKPLKVYLLSGQSNMVGMASAGTLEHIKRDEKALREYKDSFDGDGTPVLIIKTMAGIGKGFADAILKLNTNN